MRLTRASSYALHALVHIAANKPTAPLASHEIAQAHKIPERFLLKVLKPLVSAGLLHSVKGPRGGYRLAKTPKEISMLDIVEAVDGPIRGLTAFHSEASNGLDRRLDSICVQAADQTRKYLGSVRLSTLAGI
jgi:Rrf2 family protein